MFLKHKALRLILYAIQVYFLIHHLIWWRKKVEILKAKFWSLIYTRRSLHLKKFWAAAREKKKRRSSGKKEKAKAKKCH